MSQMSAEGCVHVASNHTVNCLYSAWKTHIGDTAHSILNGDMLRRQKGRGILYKGLPVFSQQGLETKGKQGRDTVHRKHMAGQYPAEGTNTVADTNLTNAGQMKTLETVPAGYTGGRA